MLKVTNVVKVTEVAEVQMGGVLRWTGDPNDDDIPGTWKVCEPGSKAIDIEQWFEKFSGQRVVITIQKLGVEDDSALIAAATIDERVQKANENHERLTEEVRGRIDQARRRP